MLNHRAADAGHVREPLLVPAMLLAGKTVVVYDPGRPARANAILAQTMSAAIERLQPGTFMMQQVASTRTDDRPFAFVAFSGDAYDEQRAFFANPSAPAFIARIQEEHLYRLDTEGVLPADVLTIDVIDAIETEPLSAADLECGPAAHKMIDVAVAHRHDCAQRPFVFLAKLVPRRETG